MLRMNPSVVVQEHPLELACKKLEDLLELERLPSQDQLLELPALEQVDSHAGLLENP